MRKNLKKAVCLSSSALILANQFAAIGMAASPAHDLFQPAADTDIQTIKNLADGKAKNFLASNLLQKGYKLNAYEAVVLSIIVEKELKKDNLSQNDRADLLEIQGRLKEIYHDLTGKFPDPARHTSDKNPIKDASNNFENQFGNMAGFPGYSSDTEGGKEPASPRQADQEAKENAIASYRKDVAEAKSPEELATAMSVINIKAHPSTEDKEPANMDVSPVSDFAGGASGKLSEIGDSENIENFEPWQYDEFATLAEDFLVEKSKEERRFYMQAYHNLKYVKEVAEGNVPLDTSVVDDTGNYYQPEATNQYQLEDSLDIGFGVRVHKALDLLFAVSAENDDGLFWQDGTKLRFSNVLFKFHPEKVQNKSKVKVRMDGSVISTTVPGTGSGIAVDTNNGGIGVAVNGTTIGYDDDNGVTVTRNGVTYSGDMSDLTKTFGKYFIGIGKLSLDFSTYTLQLSDCKAVELGYKDAMEGLTFVVAKPHSKEEGSEDKNNPKAGIYDRFVYAAQYATKRLIPSMDLAFNFATARDKGDLDTPAGTSKTNTTVYGLAFKSNERIRNTQFQGELARSVNTYGIGTASSKQVSGNADYLDLSHRFSSRMSGTLHLVNIDGAFDAASMVEDKTGDYLLTDNNGDGKPDYEYAAGQRGLDLALAYRFPESASLAFGLSRYSMTTNNGSYTDIYIAGNKSWDLSDGGTFGIQQRFERRKASEESWIHNASNTTFSLEDAQPWKDASVSSHLQITRDKVEGNDKRFDLTVAQNFYPLERVIVTPKFEYSKKKGEIGLDKEAAEDSTTIINSLVIGYEVIPDELTLNFLISKEKYDVISADIDESTGRNVDGERRNILGRGIGLVWRPKAISGLEAAVGYRRDRVHYFEPKEDWSSQDVWDAKVSYSRNLGQMLQASLSYDYHAAKDRIKPIYDEVTRTVELSLDATIDDDSVIRIQHSYSKYYKPLDASSNYKEQTTTITMTNKF